MVKRKKIAIIEKGCVACGVCERACPLGAIEIYRGIRAAVDGEDCVGCGKCEKACPAGIIEIHSREGRQYEKTA